MMSARTSDDVHCPFFGISDHDLLTRGWTSNEMTNLIL